MHRSTPHKPHPFRLRAALPRLLAGLGLLLLAGLAQAAPPYRGTIFLAPNLITSADRSDYLAARYIGQGRRQMFDRRANAFVTYNAYLFQVSYANGQQVEAQVNPEYGSPAAARTEVEFYATAIGRLPRALRTRVATLWIHRGDQPFGGGNSNLLIHTGSIASGYIRDGILEETLAHEASHTSLDPDHAQARNWLRAQAGDGEYISTYARDNPGREDVAETFVMWLAVRHGRSRIDPNLYNTVLATVPNRLAYFDALSLELAPYAGASR